MLSPAEFERLQKTNPRASTNLGAIQRTKFGPISEKLDPTQMELALEKLETAIAETQARIAALEKTIEARTSNFEKASLG